MKSHSAAFATTLVSTSTTLGLIGKIDFFQTFLSLYMIDSALQEASIEVIVKTLPMKYFI